MWTRQISFHIKELLLPNCIQCRSSVHILHIHTIIIGMSQVRSLWEGHFPDGGWADSSVQTLIIVENHAVTSWYGGEWWNIMYCYPFMHKPLPCNTAIKPFTFKNKNPFQNGIFCIERLAVFVCKNKPYSKTLMELLQLLLYNIIYNYHYISNNLSEKYSCFALTCYIFNSIGTTTPMYFIILHSE